MSSSPTIFGIRHHGPGSARSLRNALADLRPDIILVEGPPDAADLIPLASHQEMTPPVALLIYVPDKPGQAVFYPFAPFSPEWIAIRYGAENGVPVRFIDLPQAHQLSLAESEESFGAISPETHKGIEEEATQPLPDDVKLLRNDPLQLIAQADGFGDGERWWEYLVEERKDSRELFGAILTLMTALREEVERSEASDANKADSAETNEKRNWNREALREAYMRKSIRTAEAEGYQQIAVVCGAWHAPALNKMPAAAHDNRLLKKLPSVKTAATWIPWTYGRLTLQSGYGAGITSPGYYHHIWESPDNVTIRWMTQTAYLLRGEDLTASPAGTIEAVRLAEALAALRGRHTPGLEELLEAARSIFCFGGDAPMQLIRNRLLISDRIGAVPAETPSIPLYQDILRIQKRLRLQPSAEARELELDLRKELDLERSRFLHRFAVLEIEWGSARRSTGTGTFGEVWKLQWHPEFVVKVIEAGMWGTTMEEATNAYAIHRAEQGTSLRGLTALINQILPAELHEAIERATSRLHDLAALTGDVLHLMEALPPLVTIVRYGNVRGTDTGIVKQVIHSIVTRTAIGLFPASISLNDEAAEELFSRLIAAHSAIALLQNQELSDLWTTALEELSTGDTIHGLIAGRCCRLLFDQQTISSEETARLMGLRLSPASQPANATAWLDGFIRNSGLILVHDDLLLAVLDQWVATISEGTFQQMLPLLRRIFSTFTHPERRQIGERVKGRAVGDVNAIVRLTETDYNRERGERVIPILQQLLGLQSNESKQTEKSEEG